jgi:hypothetical protein
VLEAQLDPGRLSGPGHGQRLVQAAAVFGVHEVDPGLPGRRVLQGGPVREAICAGFNKRLPPCGSRTAAAMGRLLQERGVALQRGVPLVAGLPQVLDATVDRPRHQEGQHCHHEAERLMREIAGAPRQRAVQAMARRAATLARASQDSPRRVFWRIRTVRRMAATVRESESARRVVAIAGTTPAGRRANPPAVQLSQKLRIWIIRFVSNPVDKVFVPLRSEGGQRALRLWSDSSVKCWKSWRMASICCHSRSASGSLRTMRWVE